MRIHQHWHHPNSYPQTLFHCSQEHLIAFNLKKNNAAGLDHSGQPNMLYPFQESASRLSVRRHLVLASCFDSYFSTVTPTLIIWTSNGIDHSLFHSITDNGRMILTHSSYWSNRDRPTHQFILNWKQLKIYMLFRLLKFLVLLKLLILIETLRTNHLGHRRSAEVITPETTVQKQQQSGVQPKRVRIFPGGYIDKSTEEYTYVRGRGRGRYVYEECGIRCKKPSMLKKMQYSDDSER